MYVYIYIYIYINQSVSLAYTKKETVQTRIGPKARQRRCFVHGHRVVVFTFTRGIYRAGSGCAPGGLVTRSKSKGSPLNRVGPHQSVSLYKIFVRSKAFLH